MTHHFTCDGCGGHFRKAWTDEEAITEAVERGDALDDPAIVCEDCYQKLGFVS